MQHTSQTHKPSSETSVAYTDTPYRYYLFLALTCFNIHDKTKNTSVRF